MDYLNEIGGLALGSRLKRLSDYLMVEVKEVYKDQNLTFEPRWFPLFSLLSKYESVSIMEASSLLNLTHPHISKLAKELEREGLLSSQTDPKDGRSRKIKLTQKGMALLEKLKPVWKSIQREVENVFPEIGVDLLNSLKKTEEYYNKNSLRNRIQENRLVSDDSKVTILEYQNRDKAEFERLNRQWLEKYFSVEQVDEELFLNPKEKIIDPGGRIFMAKVGEKIVGTCSLLKDGDSYEIAKMAIDESSRGLGLGNKLMEKCLEYVKSQKGSKVYLVTNSILLPAIRLYQKYGFTITKEGPHPTYKRLNVYMEKCIH